VTNGGREGRIDGKNGGWQRGLRRSRRKMARGPLRRRHSDLGDKIRDQ